jgi:hypothetical protein
VSGAEDVTPVADVHNRDDARVVINPVNDSVGASPGAEAIVEGREQALADPMELFQQPSRHELVGGCGDGFR